MMTKIFCREYSSAGGVDACLFLADIQVATIGYVSYDFPIFDQYKRYISDTPKIVGSILFREVDPIVPLDRLFNIVMIAANEYGAVAQQDCCGIQLIDDGKVVEKIIPNKQYIFVVHGKLTPWYITRQEEKND